MHLAGRSHRVKGAAAHDGVTSPAYCAKKGLN
jgi:hypothetical protein